MDPLAIVIIVVVLAGITWTVFYSGSDEPKAPAVKSETVKPVGKPTAPKKSGLPSDSELTALTKAKLEELGRTLGVELDKRKTKANMIADLKSQAK